MRFARLAQAIKNVLTGWFRKPSAQQFNVQDNHVYHTCVYCRSVCDTAKCQGCGHRAKAEVRATPGGITVTWGGQ